MYKYSKGKVQIESSVTVAVTELGSQSIRLPEEDRFYIRGDDANRIIGIALNNYASPVIQMETKNLTTSKEEQFFFQTYEISKLFSESEIDKISFDDLIIRHEV